MDRIFKLSIHCSGPVWVLTPKGKSMLSNDEFLKARPRGIGGSDVAAMLGLSPYKTPVQLWAEKVSKNDLPLRQGLELRFGHHLEPLVADAYERATGLHTVTHAGPIFHPVHGFMFASVDRLVINTSDEVAEANGVVTADRVLECKTASVFNRSEWGEVGTDQIPAHYLLQCAWYLAVTGCERADIAVIIGNADFRVYTLWRDPRLEALLISHATRFWQENVLSGRPPAIKNAQDARILFPTEVPNQFLEADESILALVEAHQQEVEIASGAADRAEEIRTQIMAQIGAAEGVRHKNKLVACWRTSKPAQRLNVQALRAAYPTIAQEFTTTSASSRRLVIRGNK